MPLVGDRVRLASRSHRSLCRLFASAPAHAPAAASSRRPTLHPSSCTRPSPSTLDPTCRHPHRRRRQSPPLPPRRSHRSLGSGVLVCGRGYAPAQCQVMSILLWSSLPAKANYLDTVCFGSALVSHEPLRNRAFAPQNRQISLRGALPRTPLGLAPPRPRFCKWCARV